MNIFPLGRTAIRIGMIMFVIMCIYGFLRIPSCVPSDDDLKPSINILVWPNVINTNDCIEFEKRTGIKVYQTYFESYESLLVKIKATGGADYDLVIIADYFIKDMIDQGIIKKIDKSKIKAWSSLHPELLNLPFDPGNQYSIPFSWEAYGLGVDMTYFADKPLDDTWGILFDKNRAPERIGMLDSALEVVSIAALYLFGPTQLMSDIQLDEVRQLLVKQKEWVVMYSDLRADYMLASKLAPVVLAISSEIYQAMRYNKNIKFLLPREGSFMMIDNFVIPAKTDKQELVYQFLNFLYQPVIIQEYVNRYKFFPAMKDILMYDNLYLAPLPPLFSRLRLFTRQVEDKKLRKLWIEIKS